MNLISETIFLEILRKSSQAGNPLTPVALEWVLRPSQR